MRRPATWAFVLTTTSGPPITMVFMNDAAMTDHGDLSLFIGCLPGEERRQIVLFPGGRVLADLREQEHETPLGHVADNGWVASTALIGALTNGGGWYIEDVTPDANGWWLKPSRPGSAAVRLGVEITPTADR